MLARKLKRGVQKLTGFWPMRPMPMGADLFYDVGVLRQFRANVIFDVGANVGQSAAEYLKQFPQATIYSFEPAAATFEQLARAFRSERRVKPFRTALGASPGAAKLSTEGATDMFHISETGTESIEVQTLDGFCRDQKLDRIDFLKVDTEGHDLEVLQGAEGMLRSQAVDLVQLEAGMNPDNKHHVPFERLKSHLEERGYVLFGIYEQAREWPSKRPNLRRTNPVFISRKAVDANSPFY